MTDMGYLMRSFLFVPADSERKLARGLDSGADALILDLEDSVAAANRPLARRQARELYFTAELIDGEEAARLGIVNRVVADDELHAETMALAKKIADGPQIALAHMKRNLGAAETESFQTVLDLEAEHQARCAFTEDHTEAVAAFNEKRRPVFKGR